MEGLALRRALDALSLLLLVLAGWLAEEHPPSRGGSDAFLFLAAFVVGTASGYRVASTAFRRGRRRRGQDPEPGRSGAAAMARFVGFWVKLAIGFVLWALLYAFFRRI